MIVSFVRVSGNRKTGPIPNTITEQASCPDSCPYKADRTCYPHFSPLGFHWMALSHGGIFPGKTTQHARPVTWDELCYRISRLPRDQIWRHNTAGDLPGIGDVIDLKRQDWCLGLDWGSTCLDRVIQLLPRLYTAGCKYVRA